MVEAVSYKNPNSTRKFRIRHTKSLHQVKEQLKTSRQNNLKKIELQKLESESRVIYYKKLIAWYAECGLFGGEWWYNAKNNLRFHMQRLEDLENDL